MNNEAMEAKEKVLAVYPEALAMRCWIGCWHIRRDRLDRDGISKKENALTIYSEEIAWIDAAFRLPARVEDATHEFIVDGTGVCGKCGRERSNTKYHPIPVAPSPIPSEGAMCLSFGCTNYPEKGKHYCSVHPPIPSATASEEVSPELENPIEDARAWHLRSWPSDKTITKCHLVGCERQLLEARKEIARLMNEISAYEMHLCAAEKVLGHSQTSARPLCNTAQKWVERAEKAESALAQRDEEIAQLKGGK